MADREYLSKKHCKCCGIRLDRVKKSQIRQVRDHDLISRLNETKKTIVPRRNNCDNSSTIECEDLVCIRCIALANSQHSRIEKRKRSLSKPREGMQIQKVVPPVNENSNDSIVLNIPRTSFTHSRCVICSNGGKMMTVPSEAYIDTFITSNIIIPKGLIRLNSLIFILYSI